MPSGSSILKGQASQSFDKSFVDSEIAEYDEVLAPCGGKY